MIFYRSLLNFWKTCEDSEKMTLLHFSWDVYGKSQDFLWLWEKWQTISRPAVTFGHPPHPLGLMDVPLSIHATPWVWIKLNVFINSLTCWVKEWVQKWSLPKHHPQKRHQISHNLVCIISGFLIFLSIIQVTEKSSLRYICTFFFIPFIFHIWATLLTSDSLDLKQEEKKNCEKNWLWFRTC
jgi:hypothetical protein